MNARLLEELQEASFARAGRAVATSFPPANRMQGETLLAFLTAHRYIVAATTRPSGTPHAAPASYVVHEGALWLPTTAGAVRLRNVAATPYVSLALIEGEGDRHAAVLMEGPASTAAADAPRAPLEEWRRTMGNDGDWIANWIVVSPVRLFSYAASGWSLRPGD